MTEPDGIEADEWAIVERVFHDGATDPAVRGALEQLLWALWVTNSDFWTEPEFYEGVEAAIRSLEAGEPEPALAVTEALRAQPRGFAMEGM